MKEIRYFEIGIKEEMVARIPETPAELDAILSCKSFPIPPVCTALWDAEDWKKWIESHQEKKTYCDECGEETDSQSVRPWACSPRCYADIMGIDEPGY